MGRNGIQNIQKTVKEGKDMKIKDIIATSAIAIMTMMISFTGHAAEKTLSCSLEKQYDACEFTVTVENAGDYDVTITSPNKTEYTGQIIDDTSCKILAKDVNRGDWQIGVKETPIIDEPTETTSSEETSEADSVIGKVKVSVRAIDLASYKVDDVKVAKDIVGLKMYLKDRNLEIEWANSNAGDITISVFDTQTQQQIDQKTVPETSYECAIPDNTKQVTVSIVPATSSNFDDAKTQYTISTDYDPKAEVSYETNKFTNKDTTHVIIESQDSYGFQFVCNDKIVQTVDTQPSGKYEYDIPIEEGENNILTYIIDTQGNMKSYPLVITKDCIKPTLTLDMEYNGAQTYNTNVQFTGSVKDYDTFTINDTEQKVSGDGKFTTDYELHDGENKVVFKATDEAGNETIYNADVIKLVKEKKKFPKEAIYAIILGVVAIAAFIYKKKKNNHSGNDDNNNDAPEKPKVQPMNTQPEPKPVTKKKLSTLQRDIIFFVGLFITALLIFKFVLIPGSVPSASMEPTLMTGDKIFVNGLAYTAHEPQRGDVVAFHSKELGCVLIKRIVGMPGDTISFESGYVYINGQPVNETYLSEDVETNCTKTFKVPNDSYFVLGDNRGDSYDARFWKNPYVTKDSIMGKYFCNIYKAKK